MSMVKKIRRGDIWYVNLDHIREDKGGSVQRGERPCCICQSNKGMNSPIYLVAPISSSKRDSYPFIQEIELDSISNIHYEQIMPVSRRQLQRYVGRLTDQQMIELDMRLAVPMGLSKTSILHIKNIKIDKDFSSRKHDDLVFMGRVILEFYETRFSFTSRQFIDFFGEEFERILSMDYLSIEEFLETLTGLKFIYRIMED